MKRNRMSKLSASLIVLVLAMSALVLLPSEGGRGQTVQTNVIEVPVQDTDGFFVSSATVDLTNVHTGAAISATLTTPGLYHADNVPAGIYRVDVVAGGYYDNHTVIVNFTGYSSLVTPTVLLKAFGSKSHTWTVTVQKASDSSVLVGATVGFFDCERNETVASATSNATGVAVVSMFTTQPTDEFVLYAKASGYNTTYEDMVVTGSGSRTWGLDVSKRVTGYVKNWAGTALLSNVVGYMISNDTSLPQIARVLKSDNGGKSFEFDAFPGDFVMVVDADNGSAYVSSMVISASETYSYPDFRLKDQVQRTETTWVMFGNDYQDFVLNVDTNWTYDESHPALLYDDVGSLRLQIDLALGDGNGVLSQLEVDAFDALMRGIGSQYVTSSGLVQVNGTLFDPGPVTFYQMDLATGSVITETQVRYAYSCTYTAHGAIDTGSSVYSVNMTARYDSYEVDHTYYMYTTSGFELVSNQSSSLVDVIGYSVVSLDPEFVAAGGQEPVAMIVEESVEPVAKSGVLDGTYAHVVYDDEGNVSYSLVAINENVTLTASGSYDPNGNPLTYSWDFADGSPVSVTSNLTVEHMFTTSATFMVNLTVIDAVWLEGWSEVEVVCDALVPTPVISVKDKTIVGNTIEVNMRETVTFNATYSTDSAVAAGDNVGVIAHFMFDWGDLNDSPRIQWTANQKNVTTSWERSGTYIVNLNVTDVVGQWVNATLTVKVNDTSNPSVSYVVMNETWDATYIENETLTFDANGTSDNVDSIDDLYFSWDFADGAYWNETGAWNVTHAFNSTGDFNILLNVTDSSGNYNVVRKLISVLSGPRPDLWIEGVSYDPGNFTEGQSGTILVNVTNKGSIDADVANVTVSFYIVRSDGTQKLLTGTWTFWNDTTQVQVSVIKPGEEVVCKFVFKPGSKGTYIIRVNVTCDNQLRPYSFTASGDDSMHVNEAAWKQWALWGGVIAIIVLIPLLLMLRGRLAKREKKGPRRERKEKEKEKASDDDL